MSTDSAADHAAPEQDKARVMKTRRINIRKLSIHVDSDDMDYTADAQQPDKGRMQDMPQTE